MTRRLLIAYAVGGTLTLIGAYAFFSTGDLSQWISVAKWFGGGVILHDFVLTPVVLVTGALLVRVVPGPYRAFAQAALYISGAVALSAFVLVLGRGRDPNVPSQQPLPYGRNLLIVVGMIWAVTSALALLRYLRTRGASAPHAPAGRAG